MTQASWEEVKRLAADLQRAQLSDSVQRLSDSNCIEIVNKLVGLNLLDIVHTVDGKEYLTQNEIGKEISEELIVRGGRVNLVDLQSAINVDFSHVDNKVARMVKEDRSLSLVNGELIDRNYTEKLAEDLNDALQDSGHVSVTDLTKQHDIPASFLQTVIKQNIGRRIDGYLDGDLLYTQKFVSYHEQVIRGAFTAITRPKSISAVISEYHLHNTLFHRIIHDLIAAGSLNGSVSGGKTDKAVYIPNIYTQAQDRWVQAFYRQNGYLEFEAVARLGITDAKGHVKKLLKGENLIYLNKCCIGAVVEDQIAALVDEALRTASFVDVQPYLPACITSQDAEKVIGTIIAKKPEAVNCCDTVVICRQFIKNCQDSFSAKMDEKANDDIKRNPNLLSLICEEDSSKFSGDTKEDRRDQRKKKQGQASKSGGGTQGREVKMRATKNKYRANQQAGDGDDDDCVNGGQDKAKIVFMTREEMENALADLHPSCPEEVVTEIVDLIYKPLTKQYHELVKDLFLKTSGVASASGRKKTHNDLQEKVGSLWSSVKMFEKGIENFPEEGAAILHKHLLNTMCTEMTNMIFQHVAVDNMMTTDKPENFSNDQRTKILASIAEEDLRKKLTKLNTSLNKTVGEFSDSMEDVCGPAQLGILLRKVDKKRERQIVHGHRMALLEQLDTELEPAVCLHLCVVILYQSISGTMLHAPGKCVPHIISYISDHLSSEHYQFLLQYQSDVIKSIKSEPDNDVKSTLNERLPELKDMAVTVKKSVAKQ